MNMKIYSAEQLKPGMITAARVETENGQILVLENTELTSRLINRIRFYRIPEIAIVEEANTESAKPNEPAATSASQPKAGTGLLQNSTFSQKMKQSAAFKHQQIDYLFLTEKIKSCLQDIVHNKSNVNFNELLSLTSELFRSKKTAIELFDFLYSVRGVNDSVYAHSLNVAMISRMIGRWLHLDPHDLDVLMLAGLLHDIGKLLIPEELLNKPGRLTDEEFQEIKKHPRYGYDILKNQNIDSRIKKAALMHHERCDGSGYPSGLTEDTIDSFAQIIAIADVYDAMTAARSYRSPMCPFQVIGCFEKEGFQKYHTRYILTFLEHIASTYQNCRAILNDGRGCNIIMLNSNALSQPIVQLDDNTCIDLSAEPSLYITALM